MASKKSLEAAAATAGMFTKAPAKTHTPKAGTRQRATEPKKEQEQRAKRETVTFSVKIDSEVLKKWRIYASIDGYGDKGKLTEAAILEYMSRHKLNPEQQKKFDTLCDL